MMTLKIETETVLKTEMCLSLLSPILLIIKERILKLKQRIRGMTEKLSKKPVSLI